MTKRIYRKAASGVQSPSKTTVARFGYSYECRAFTTANGKGMFCTQKKENS